MVQPHGMADHFRGEAMAGSADLYRDNASARPHQPRGAYGWSGVYGTGLSVDPVSGLIFVIMTQTAVEGMTISDDFVRAFYDQPGSR